MPLDREGRQIAIDSRLRQKTASDLPASCPCGLKAALFNVAVHPQDAGIVAAAQKSPTRIVIWAEKGPWGSTVKTIPA